MRGDLDQLCMRLGCVTQSIFSWFCFFSLTAQLAVIGSWPGLWRHHQCQKPILGVWMKLSLAESVLVANALSKLFWHFISLGFGGGEESTTSELQAIVRISWLSSLEWAKYWWGCGIACLEWRRWSSAVLMMIVLDKRGWAYKRRGTCSSSFSLIRINSFS